MTDQAPELLFLCLKCEQHYNVEKVTTHCPVCGWSARPPSERPVAQVREALELAERIKVLPAYTGRELDARLYRVDLGDKTATDDKSVILIGVEHRDLLVRALTAERHEAAVAWRWRSTIESEGTDWSVTLRKPRFATPELFVVEPLYAIQHDEPGRETMK